MKSIILLISLVTFVFSYNYEEPKVFGISNTPWFYNGEGNMSFNIEFEMREKLRNCYGDAQTSNIISGAQNHTLTYNYIRDMLLQCETILKTKEER